MVYESDFYTTRRPYRATPSVSSYTVSTIVPSRQIRIFPGLGKVHVVHSYDRLIPYIGHKRLTVVSAPPHTYRVRPSVIVREIDRITHKARPYIYYTPSLVHSEPITFFDDEARLIRLQSNSLLRTIHAPVPRVHSPWPITTTKVRYHYEFPSSLPSARITSPDDYIHRVLTPIKNVYDDIYNISHYYTTPLKKYLGPISNLSCTRYSGGKPYSRRRNLTLQDCYAMQNDTVRNDIQLLSYYIRANKDRKAREGNLKASASLDANRPSRHFSKPTMMLEPSEEIKQLREDRAERMKKIHEVDAKPVAVAVEDAGAKIKRSTKKQEEERLAEERALAEEKARKEEAAKKEQAKKEEEARRAELARQEALAAQAAAERQAEIERKAELARQEELAKKAEEERKAEEARLAAEKAAEEARIAAEKAEQARLEEEKRQAELAKQEEERQQLLRLEEIARQAEEEKEKELARQAEELAELARQEAELAEQARKEAELAELAKQEAELAELERQEKELAELDKQDRDAAEAAKQESELEEQATENAEVAAAESNIPTTEESSDEPVTSDPEATASEPEPAAEAEVTGSETEPEPVIEEPETPEAEE